MHEFGFKFRFFSNSENPISQDVIYELRREVALHLEHSGFGVYMETPEMKFRNVAASPAIDEYDDIDRELLLSYYLPFPLRDGDLHRIMFECVPELKTFARSKNCELIFRTVID